MKNNQNLRGLEDSSMELRSPKTYFYLKEVFSEVELEQIGKSFLNVIRIAGPEEATTIREPGVSFNPRPARLCEILCREGDEKNLSAFIAVLASVVIDQRVAPEGFSPEETINAGAIINFPNIPETPNKPSLTKETIELCFLCRSIDKLRHLHMSSMSKTEVKQQIESIKLAVTNLSQLAPDSKLRLMFQTSLRHAEARSLK